MRLERQSSVLTTLAPARAHLDCAACQRRSGEYESHRQSPPPPAGKTEICRGRQRRDDRAHAGHFVWGLMSIDPKMFEPIFRQNRENARHIKSERIWSMNTQGFGIDGNELARTKSLLEMVKFHIHCAVCNTQQLTQPPLALSVPLSRFTPRVGGGSAFFVRPHDTLMTKTTSNSSAMRTLAWISLCLLIPAGFGLLYSALIGDSHGLKAWLLPFAPWLCTLPAYRRLRQKRD